MNSQSKNPTLRRRIEHAKSLEFAAVHCAGAQRLGPDLDAAQVSTAVALDELSRIAGPRAAVLVDPEGRAQVVERDHPEHVFEPRDDLAWRVALARGL